LHSVNTCILAKTAAAAGVISFAVTFAAWRAERSPKGEAWWARQVAHKSTSSTACKKVVTKKPLWGH